MDQMKKAIEVNNLSFAYEDQNVLDSVSFSVETRSLTFILGRNGSGKSTLLKIIAGILKARSGEVTVLGRDNTKFTYAERARIIGFLNQQHKAVFPFSVEDVVLTGRAAYVNYIPREQDRQAAAEAIKKAGIMHLRHRNYTELSGGEQQLVMIARSLAQNPEVLLLDEPTTHLDFTNQSHLLNLLRKLVREGLTILVVMHDPNLAFMFGDDFLFMKDKKVIHPGETSRAWDNEFLSSIYHSRLETISYRGRAFLVPYVN